MARERPALQARYDIGWGRAPQTEETETETETVFVLTIKPEGRKPFEHDYSGVATDLLDELEIPYEVDEQEVATESKRKNIDRDFIRAAEAIAKSLEGDFGACRTSYDGSITLETHAEFGASKHIERRAVVEGFYASRGLDPGAWTLECRHIFSAATCKPLNIESEANADAPAPDDEDASEESPIAEV